MKSPFPHLSPQQGRSAYKRPIGEVRVVERTEDLAPAWVRGAAAGETGPRVHLHHSRHVPTRTDPPIHLIPGPGRHDRHSRPRAIGPQASRGETGHRVRQRRPRGLVDELSAAKRLKRLGMGRSHTIQGPQDRGLEAGEVRVVSPIGSLPLDEPPQTLDQVQVWRVLGAETTTRSPVPWPEPGRPCSVDSGRCPTPASPDRPTDGPLSPVATRPSSGCSLQSCW